MSYITINREPEKNNVYLNNQSAHIYYNLDIKPTANNNIAIFSENRVLPIVEKPEDYELAIVRFRIPSQYVPIFLWRDGFFVTITYAGVDFTTELLWTPNSPAGDFDWYGRAVWHYQDFIDSINDGLKTSFDNFVAGTAGFVGKPTLPPFMSFNPTSERFSIYAPIEYNSSAVNPVEVWFSVSLYEFFPSLQSIYGPINTVKQNQIIIKSKYGLNEEIINSANYYEMQEETSTLNLWWDINSLVFETGSIPVVSENLSGQTNKTLKIITDFLIPPNSFNLSAYTFEPNGPLRYMSLQTSQPLTRIDLKIYWRSKQGENYELRIPENDSVSMKLHFKQLGDNDYY